MPTPDIAAIRARLKAATPGPWRCVNSLPDLDICAEDEHVAALGAENPGFNADLIANAPADLAALCDEVERLRPAVREHVDSLADHMLYCLSGEDDADPFIAPLYAVSAAHFARILLGMRDDHANRR